MIIGLIKRAKRKIKGISSEEKINQLKANGADIGKKVVLFDPSSVVIDSTRPWLLKIGAYTKITHGVVILTHDYSLSVLRRVYGEWIGEGVTTEIGENCFIGVNSVILMGSHIGNNVIVGAGSVVRGTIPDNCVIAGNPAKIICTLEEHYQNRKRKTIQECKECIKQYYKANGKMPKPSDLSGFKFLFAPRDKKTIEQYKLDFACNGDEPKEVEEVFYNSKPYWNSFEEMINETKKEMMNEGL